MRNKRTYPCHLRLKLSQKYQILRQLLISLSGGTYHKASADLVAQFLQIIETAFAVFKAHFLRV